MKACTLRIERQRREWVVFTEFKYHPNCDFNVLDLNGDNN